MTGPEAAASIRAMLDRREPGRTLCPSEIARAWAGPAGDWRAAMPAVHAAVDRLTRNGEVTLSWRGRRLVERAGPYRIAAPQ